MTPEQQALYYRKELLEAEEKIKSLESKLAEAEKRTEEIQGRANLNNIKLIENIKTLQAEAKAVRSKTIEECAKVAESYPHLRDSIDVQQQYDIARGIRALNSGKE